MIEIPHPGFANHNGGQLQFLGNLLYFGTGDGGSGGDPPNNAQNKDVLLGKLLRIDPRPSGGRPYSIPAGNPFAGPAAGAARSTATACGTRSDSPSTRVSGGAAADRDRRRRPEPLRGARLHDGAAADGANFGWDAFEGYSAYRDENSGTPDPGGTVKPIFAYPHSRGGSCSIIGGYVVRDRSLGSLYGATSTPTSARASCGAWCRTCTGRAGTAILGPTVASPSSFGEDDQGRVYVASLEGPVYRLVAR